MESMDRIDKRSNTSLLHDNLICDSQNNRFNMSYHSHDYLFSSLQLHDRTRKIGVSRTGSSSSLSCSNGSNNDDVYTSFGDGREYVKDREDDDGGIYHSTGHNGEFSFWRCSQHKGVVWLYGLCVLFVMGDQNLMAPNLTAISVDLNISEEDKYLQVGGMCSLLFFGLGAPSSILIGRWIDGTDASHGGDEDNNRMIQNRTLWLVGMTFWSSFCCFGTAGLVFHNYSLWLWRGFSGIAVGSILPLTSSLLADYYPPQHRTAVMAIQSICIGLGIALGQGLAAFVFTSTHSWRWPFAIWGMFTFISSVLLYIHSSSTDEPIKGSMDNINKNYNHHHHEPNRQNELNIMTTSIQNDDDTSTYTSNNSNHHPKDNTMTITGNKKSSWLLFMPSSPTLVFAMIQGAPGCIPWGIFNTYLNDYLAQDCNLSIPTATGMVMVFGIGNLIGMFLCTALSSTSYFSQTQTNYNNNNNNNNARIHHGNDNHNDNKHNNALLFLSSMRRLVILGGSSSIVACIPLYFILQLPSNDNGKGQNDGDQPTPVTTYYWIGKLISCFTCGVASAITGPIVKSTIQNITTIQNRGQAFAMLNIWDDIGRGLGPFVVAKLVQFCHNNRSIAFQYGGILGWFFCGILNLSMYYTIPHDYNRIHKNDTTIANVTDEQEAEEEEEEDFDENPFQLMTHLTPPSSNATTNTISSDTEFFFNKKQ